MLIINKAEKCSHVVARVGCACCRTELRAVNARLGSDLTRRGFVGGASVAMLGLTAYSRSARAQTASGKRLIIRGVQLFDGTNLNKRVGITVVVEGQMIVDVVQGDIGATDGATVIEGGGRTLIPGLIDAHWHTMLAAMPLAQAFTLDVGDIHIAAVAQAERTVMRGFTSVRDMGGPAFALKRAVDAGSAVGPRIYPSGGLVSQTSGHGDFRNIWELPGAPGKLSRAEVLGAAALADGRDAVLRATREQLMLGASQIKLIAGGGISSVYDPIDVTEYLPEEIEAAVLAAADWGTYVAAHVYTPAGIKRCLQAGVRSIEHGQLADEEAVMMMADTGASWSLQPFVRELNSKVDVMPALMLEKWKAVWEGTDNAYAMAAKHGVPMGFGCDFLFDPTVADSQGKWLAAMTRWMTPAQALKAATSDNAFILGMSGPRNPYPGQLGVIAKGAYADMILVEGDPTEDLSLVADPDANFRVIVKDGIVHKNTL